MKEKLKEKGILIYLAVCIFILLALVLKMLNVSSSLILESLPAFLSAIAAGLSYLVAKASLDHSKLRDQCHLSIITLADNSNDVLLSVSIKNMGPGLAILESGTLSLGASVARLEYLGELHKLAHEIEFNTSCFDASLALSIGRNTSLPPNCEVCILKIRNIWDENDPSMEMRKEKIRKIQNDIKLDLRYRDIHGNVKAKPDQ